MNYILETERLQLRQLAVDDTAFIIELLNSPGWLQNIGDRNVKTEEQAVAYLQNGPLKSYAQNGFGLYLVEVKEEHKAIGMCGLIQRDYLESPDIGFALLPGFHGKGYAYEMARATLAYAREHLQLNNIAAIVLPGNERSIRLIEKLGLQLAGTITAPSTNEELLLYRTGAAR